jgi:gamma-glutamyltranspeptidase
MGRLTRGSRRGAKPRNISWPENQVDTDGDTPHAMTLTRPRPLGPWEQLMGHAHAILLREDGLLAGSADPRGDGIAATW